VREKLVKKPADIIAFCCHQITAAVLEEFGKLPDVTGVRRNREPRQTFLNGEIVAEPF
jgi:hypothetical protein